MRLNSLKEDRIDRNYDVCHFCVAGGKVPLTNRMGAMAGFPAPTGSSGGGAIRTASECDVKGLGHNNCCSNFN